MFLRVQISFSVFAMSVLGGLLASSVRLRLTSLASSPPKTIMAHTEKNIFTLRNNLTAFLWHQKWYFIYSCLVRKRVITPQQNEPVCFFMRNFVFSLQFDVFPIFLLRTAIFAFFSRKAATGGGVSQPGGRP